MYFYACCCLMCALCTTTVAIAAGIAIATRYCCCFLPCCCPRYGVAVGVAAVAAAPPFQYVPRPRTPPSHLVVLGLQHGGVGLAVSVAAAVVARLGSHQVGDYVHRDGEDDGGVLLRRDVVQRLEVAELKNKKREWIKVSLCRSHC